MIEATDLRIGNLISYEKTTHVVRAIGNPDGYDFIYSSWVGALDELPYYCDHINQHEGIPINKKWLMKAGFEKEGATYWKMVDLNTTTLTIMLSDGKWKATLYQEPEYGQEEHVVILHTLESIHDLQNLWKIISGTELTFNS